MAGRFEYFVAGGGAAGLLEEVREGGLGYALPDAGEEDVGVSVRSGMSITAAGEVLRGTGFGVGDGFVGGEGLSWRCLADWTGVRPAHERFFVGWREGALPGCGDLARRRVRPGVEVRLGDGGLWHVPRAVVWREGGAVPLLPSRVVFSEGRAYRQLQDEYGELVERAMEIVGELLDGSACFDSALVVRVLGLNYRVGMAELSLLGVLDDDSLVRVMEVFCDVTGALDLSKKKTGIC